MTLKSKEIDAIMRMLDAIDTSDEGILRQALHRLNGKYLAVIRRYIEKLASASNGEYDPKAEHLTVHREKKRAKK